MSFLTSVQLFIRFVATIVIAVSFAHAQPALPALPANAVSLEQMRDAIANRTAVVFDIRERDEHAKGVIPGTRVLPMSQIAQRAQELSTQGNMPVMLICNTQNRSQRTVAALERAGYTQVFWVNGGTSEWIRRGWPVVLPPAPAASSARL